MKPHLLAVLVLCVANVSLQAATPPSTEEQGFYQQQIEDAVDAFNARRAQLSLPALTPLEELCQAARENSESGLLPGAPAVDNIFTQATNDGFSGTGMAAVFFSGVLTGEELAEIVLTDFAAEIEDPAATFVGVGMVLIMDGTDEIEAHWSVITGRAGGGAAPYGTDGIETDSGRGLPDPALIADLSQKIITGNSRDGFTYEDFQLPQKVVDDYLDALADVKKKQVISTEVASRVNYKVPRPIWQVVKRLKLKGKLPVGLKFKPLQGKLVGKAKEPGRYTVSIGGDLIAPIDGKTKMKPYKIKIVVK